MTRGVTLYVLLDPRDGAVRYVGQTVDPYHRYHGHLFHAKGSGHKRHDVSAWIGSLLKLGLMPEMLEIGVYDVSEIDAFEVSTIDWFRRLGYKLTNITPGGECGARGWRPSAEQRRRRSEAQKGRPGPIHTESGRKRISDARKASKASRETRERMRESQKASWASGERKKPTALSKEHKQNIGTGSSAAWLARDGFQVVDELGNMFNTCAEAARFHGGNADAINNVVNGRTKTSAGLKFFKLLRSTEANDNGSEIANDKSAEPPQG